MITIFPRSHERGPIEANATIRGTTPDGTFPRSHERGPIEASGNPAQPTALQFPRSHERGPIEAPS